MASTSAVGISGSSQNIFEWFGDQLLGILRLLALSTHPRKLRGGSLQIGWEFHPVPRIKRLERNCFCQKRPPDKMGGATILRNLLQQVAQGSPPKIDGLDPKTTAIPKQDELQQLGSIQTIVYVGEVANTRDANSAYDVEFSNGDLICNIHRHDDGELDTFFCG